MKHRITIQSITNQKRPSLRIVFLVAFLAFLSARPAHTYQTPMLSAEEIVGKAISAYASCKSYMDAGRVRTIFLTKLGRRTDIKPFSTAFVRLDAFRFEFQSRRGEEEWNIYIVWRQGNSVKSWWTIKSEGRESNELSSAIAGATGVSSGSAHRIPALLMPDLIRGSSVKCLTGMKLLGEEEVETKSDYKIEGQDLRGNTETLWIDKQRFLILKIFEKRKFEPNATREGFETETTTFYDPQINEAVLAEKLAFNPPAK